MNTEANKESVLPASCEPIYTKEQLENAIAQERERIAKLFDNGSDNPLGFHIAAAIRASA